MGNRIACLPRLQSLSFLHCITEDVLFWKLPLNKSLKRLLIGTYFCYAEHCNIDYQSFSHILRITHLEELVFGRPLSYSEVPGMRYRGEYERIMWKLKNLKKLEMPGPNLRHADFSKQFLTQIKANCRTRVASSLSRTCRG